MSKEQLEFLLNGQPISVEFDTGKMLVDVLRDELGMKSVKKACEEGECGACTVIMDGLAVASCIMPAGHAQGSRISTVEGLATDGHLHPLQEAFLEEGAVQCGFCTPGMLMSAKALLDANSQPTRQQIREAMSGNICRCTGYKKIISAIARAADEISKS
jgi:carbon-monoxide dehydrogenase small subunit